VNIVADENVDSLLVKALVAAGHAVRWISKENPSIDDAEVLAFALDKNSLLITEDKGFGEKVYRDSHASSGVLLLRLHNLSREERVAVATEAIRTHGNQLLGRFSVLTNRKLRSRALPLN
jgi:predicted nuclease of predicted toxin-antitoxin system